MINAGRTLTRPRAALAIFAMLLATMASAEAANPLSIEVLSNRADLIAGGDALVAIDLNGADP